MKLAEYIKANGSRAAAVKIVDIKINKILGISVHDLPDTAQLSEVYDSIEDVLNNYDLEYGMPKIKEILRGITQEFIEEICW